VVPVIEIEQIPLETTTDGVLRVSGSRVTLDTIVAAFKEGATAEEIAQQYPSLRLADVYAAIGYYLRHRPQIETYLQERQQQADAVRRQNESQFDSRGIRDRLMAQCKYSEV